LDLDPDDELLDVTPPGIPMALSFNPLHKEQTP